MIMRSLVAIGLIIALLAIAAYSSLFIVGQKDQALVLDFGKPSREITEPGLNAIMPIIQNVVFFDKRILALDMRPQEIIVSDQKRLVVDAFARYRIVDPLLFFQTVGSDQGAKARIGDLIGASLRSVLGAATFSDLVRDKRETLMRQITSEVNAKAAELGVTIVDVRIKRADLPPQNSQAVFARMKTGYQREAAEWRAKGEEQSRIIRADADRQVTVLKAKATQDSESIRGEGEAKSNSVLVEAFGKDPEFFAFYRSIQAYSTSLQGSGTKLVISPDSDFFRYFADPTGKTAAGQAGK
jgi:modulator of FtsH protease HflC